MVPILLESQWENNKQSTGTIATRAILFFNGTPTRLPSFQIDYFIPNDSEFSHFSRFIFFIHEQINIFTNMSECSYLLSPNRSLIKIGGDNDLRNAKLNVTWPASPDPRGEHKASLNY